MRNSLKISLLALAILSFSLVAAAQTPNYPAPTPGDYVLKDFKFASGQSLPELRIHYRTLGEPRKDAQGRTTNAVLILHGTGGSGENFLNQNFAGFLFIPNGMLDARKYYIVIPDGIGHGKSTKPSDGLRAKFPRYGYDDMVTAQYRLLTEGLGVNHLRLVMGTSMGGMHSWVWGEKYPDFMDGLVPLACLPVEIAGRNRMMRKMLMDSIRTDPEWKDGNYEAQPRGLRGALALLLVMGSSPLQMQRSHPTREHADRYVDEYMNARLASTDANDLLYQVDSSRNYNPAPLLDRIRAQVLFINSADDYVNPPELGIAEREIRKVKHGRFVQLPISDDTRGHGTHTLPAVWKKHLEQFLRELPAQ